MSSSDIVIHPVSHHPSRHRAAFLSFLQEHAVVILIFIIGLALRLYMAGFDPFLHTWDESYHALVARNMMNNPLRPVLIAHPVTGYDINNWCYNYIWLHKQPLFMWQMALSMKLFGVSEFALRLPSAIMGSLTILMVYRISMLLTHNKHTSIIAAAFMCCSHYQLGFISGIFGMDHNDIAFGFYVLAGIWCYTEYMVSGKWYWALLAGIFSGCAILNKWLTGLLVFSAWGIRLLFTKDRKQFLHLLAALTVCVLVFMPWQLYTFNHYPAEAAYAMQFNARHITEVIESHSGDDRFYYNNFPLYFGTLTWLLVLPGALIMLLKRSHVYDKTIALSLLCYCTVVYIFFSFFVKTKIEGYFYAVVPFCYIFMAIALYHAGSFLKLKWLLPALTVAACWQILDPINFINYRLHDAKRQALIHNANLYRHLQERLPPDIGIVATDYFEYVNVMFYNPRISACIWDISPQDRAKLAAERKRIAVFQNHGTYKVPDSLAAYPYLYIIPEQVQQTK